MFGAESAAGTLKVKVTDEAGKPLPARVHVRDAAGRYLLAPGHETRQRAMHDKTGPICGDWFYTDGEFSIEVGAGEAQIDIAHGPEYAGIHETIAIAAGQTAEKTYTLRRLIDLVALGWYNGDEHLHQPPDSTMMRRSASTSWARPCATAPRCAIRLTSALRNCRMHCTFR